MISRRKFIQNTGAGLFVTAIPYTTNALNNIKKYDSIIPCGIKDRGITNLMEIKSQNYENLEDRLIDNFISNLKNLTS